MKLKSLSISALAMLVALVGCSKKETPISDIIVTVNPTSVSLNESAQDQIVSLKATRAWKAEIKYEGDETDWVTVNPARGEASNAEQTVTVTVKGNTGRDRVAKVKFSIGLDDATLTVSQKGPGGSSDPVYFNDFDKSAAVKDGNNWPYVYQSECWKNEDGTGVAGVEYVTDGNKATVRNNSNSTGSGVNNLFFGKAPAFFCVKKIALPATTNYTISCLGIRNVYDAKEGESVFDHSQFKLYISNDGKKWIELEYHFNNGDPDNAWDLLESTFSVPAGTSTLSIGIPTPSEASTYRIDDLKLDVASAPGASIDFSKGIEIKEFDGGGDDPVNPGTPEGDGSLENPFNATAAYQTAAALEADKVTEAFYYIKGFIKEIASVDTGTYGNASFYIVDKKDGNTEKFYCFQVMYLNGEKFKSADQIKVGDEVGVYAQLVNYKGNTPETNGKGSGRIYSLNGDTPDPAEDVETESVAEVLKAAKGVNVKLKNALVVASAQTGYLVTDANAKDYVFVYEGPTPTEDVPAVGSQVTVEAVMAEYSGMPQLTTPSTTVTATGAAFTYPTPEDITSTLGGFTSDKVKYVSYTGKLTIDGTYYNVAVPGSEVLGAFLPPSIDVSAFAGVDNITYTGYYIYTTGSGKYVYLILTDAHPREGDYFSVSPTELSVAATATSGQITVSSSVDWTASSDNAAFTVSPASGSGNGTITVNFDENTTTEDRSAVITVATTSDKVSTKSYTVTITQKAPSTGDEYTSNVTWTLGTNAYDKTSSSSQNGTVNGVELDNILKLGTSKAAGDATIKLPAGTSKVVFYCIGWNKAADPVVKFTLGDTTKEITVKANTTLAGNPPYTLTVADSDRYEIDLGAELSAEMSVKVETLSASPRVAFIGIQAK